MDFLNKDQQKWLLRVAILCFYFGMLDVALGATYYMPGDFPNLQAAFAGMTGGDTLIIKDGIYTGDVNVLDHRHLPPSGTDTSYTIIRAENDGAVIFDGENSRAMFSLYGGGTAGNPHHIIFQGLQWRNSNGTLVTNVYADHIKFIRCSCYDGAGDGFSALYCSYFLFEDCWSWGGARKHFYIGKESSNIIVRRCVVRHDRYASYSDQEAFMAYDSHDVEFQNCIAIDGDQGDYYIPVGDTTASAFTTRTAGLPVYNVQYRGCISIGNDDMIGWQGSNSCDFSVKNCLHWDGRLGNRIRYSGSEFDHCTFGSVSGTGSWSILAYLEGGDPINNSLLYSAYQGIYAESSSSDYNSLFNITNNYSGSPGAHDLSRENNNEIDPISGSPGNGIIALKYLVRIENSSDLDGAASDGGDIGATILYKIGRDGSLWGDTGYNEVTNQPLWPFPNEALIKQQMSQYIYDANGDGTPEISGNRGFCADGTGLYGGPITLTSYIWEYLGNPCPADICGGSSTPANNPPVANAGPNQTVTDLDGNGNEQVTFDGSSSTDSDGSIVSYTWKENGTQIGTGINPSVSLSIGAHTITLTVQDNDGDTGSDTVNVTVNSPADTTAPDITSVHSDGVTATSATISWTTDDAAFGKVKYGLTQSYGQEIVNQTLATAHQVILTGLTPDTTYNYSVESIDANGNAASSANYNFTTAAQAPATEMHTLQDFEDGVIWLPGGSQDTTGNGRGWAFLNPGPGDLIEIDNIGANNTGKSLKITFTSENDTLYFRSDDKITDHFPEAAGANRMSFYVRFPADFPIQPLPFRYDTWQLGTYIHDPNDWSDTHQATSEDDHGIHHYYHRLTMEQVGDGWVKYIITTQPDQANYSGSTIPPDRGSEYFDNFGRFYFHFGPGAGGPDPGRPFTIWIDEIKFYHDDGTVGGQIHVGGQDDAGFDGEFIPDSSNSVISPPQGFMVHPTSAYLER